MELKKQWYTLTQLEETLLWRTTFEFLLFWKSLSKSDQSLNVSAISMLLYTIHKSHWEHWNYCETKPHRSWDLIKTYTSPRNLSFTEIQVSRNFNNNNNNKSRGNLGISEFTSANPCFGHRSDFYIEILMWLQYFPKWSNSEWDIAPNVAREFMLKPYTEFIGWKCWLKFSNLIHSGKLLDTSSLWNCQHVKRERHGDPKTQSVPLQIRERCGGELWQGEI